MDWNAVIAVSELIGVVAVVASIVYLATEVRLAKEIAKDSSYKILYGNVQQHFQSVGSSENRDVFLKGLMNFDELTPGERVTFEKQMAIYVLLVESTLFSVDIELIDQETMEDWAYFFQTRLFAYPGSCYWWSEAHNLYPPKTQLWVDLQVQEANKDSDIWGIK